MKYDVRAIANEILRIANERMLPLTKMQLIKLAYMAHGWGLAFLGRSIVEDTPHAWPLGPVYPTLYSDLSDYTSEPVVRFIKEPQTKLPFTISSLDTGINQLLDDVVTQYGSDDGFALSNLTHQDGTPWSKVYGNGEGKYKEIPEQLISSYYNKLREERNLDANRYT